MKNQADVYWVVTPSNIVVASPSEMWVFYHVTTWQPRRPRLS